MRLVFLLLVSLVCFTGWTADSFRHLSVDAAELGELYIEISHEGDGYRLNCHSSSCAWGSLAFTIAPFQKVLVDGQGTWDPTAGIPVRDFLFSITSSDDGRILLEGVKGTAWNELNFTLPENAPRAIDQWGLTRRRR